MLMPVRNLLWFLVCAMALTSCASFNATQADAPQMRSSVEPLAPAPRIAVVLSSGGPRGYAHIGVIKALEQAGIVPDLIVGSSVGALIGAFWASGLPADAIETKALSGGPLTLFDLNPFADRGWIRGQRLQDYVNRELSDAAVESFPRRLVVVATRREDKAAHFAQRGNVGIAVRASSAVPGILSPVGIRGVEFEDGDVSLPLAVKAARDAGAQFVIAVDVSAHEGSAPEGTGATWLARDIERRAKINAQLPYADFVIHPDLGYLASPRRAYFEKALAIGYAHASSRMPALQAVVAQRFAQRSQ
jgi:NTE family protein